jgi:UDP-GlcNAc:undecaprenyl-phosphate GlcNAc-1-phosphate transferase
MRLIIPVLIAFFASFLSALLFRSVALKFNLLDTPDERKPHKNATPLLGGAAVFAGIVSGLLYDMEAMRFFSGLLTGSIIILIIGIVDDIRGLSSKIRLLGQLAAAIIIISLGYRIDFLPNNFWGTAGEIILTLMWIVGLINSLNYLDGLDGLAAGIASICAFCFAVISYLSGQYLITLMTLVMSASCAAFLPHNFRQKKMFLGDAGSTLMGYILASTALIGHWAGDNIIRISVPLLILGVPIFDMTFTTIMRIKEKKVRSVSEWLDYAGKDHFHHRLIDLGLNPRSSVLFIYFISIALGIGAAIISKSHGTTEGLLAILQAVIIFSAIGVLMVVGARRRSGWDTDNEGLSNHEPNTQTHVIAADETRLPAGMQVGEPLLEIDSEEAGMSINIE